jgi:hypothetical protein
MPYRPRKGRATGPRTGNGTHRHGSYAARSLWLAAKEEARIPVLAPGSWPLLIGVTIGSATLRRLARKPPPGRHRLARPGPSDVPAFEGLVYSPRVSPTERAGLSWPALSRVEVVSPIRSHRTSSTRRRLWRMTPSGEPFRPGGNPERVRAEPPVAATADVHLSRSSSSGRALPERCSSRHDLVGLDARKAEPPGLADAGIPRREARHHHRPLNEHLRRTES